MAHTKLRNGIDAHVVEDRPTENFGKSGVLRLDNAGADEKKAYLFWPGGPRPGAYIVEATITVFTRGDTWTGAQTIAAKSVIDAWKERSVTWRTRPDVDASNAGAGGVSTVPARTAIEIDVTDIVRHAFLGTGVPFYGFELSGANGNLYSFEAENPDLRPFLDIDYTELPAAAYDLVPGQDAVVSVPKPILRWSYFDPDEGEQLSFQLEISTSDVLDADGTFHSTLHDSGVITSPDPEYDLAAWIGAGVPDSGSIFWHVRVQNAAGQWGPYSDIVSITRRSKGTLVINAPTSQIEETTPTIATTLTGRDQRALEYLLERLDVETVGSSDDGWGGPWGGPWGGGGSVVVSTAAEGPPEELWEKPRFKAPTVSGATYEFDIPSKIIRKRQQSYRLTVRSWDTVIGRVATPGDLNYVQSSIVFSWDDPMSPPVSPTALVAHVGDGPGVELTWDRASVPDFWMLLVDGQDESGHIDALDWQRSGTHYAVTYYGAEPGIEHEYEIIAVVNSTGVKKTSASNPTVTATTRADGIWFVDKDFGRDESPASTIRLIDDKEAPSAIGEDTEYFTIVGRQDVASQTDNIRGYEGTVAGDITTVEERLRLLNWKGRPAKVLRLVMGDLNIPVRLGATAVGRIPTTLGYYPVTVEVRQSAEFPVAMRG